jgi:hypothetical protein
VRAHDDGRGVLVDDGEAQGGFVEPARPCEVSHRDEGDQRCIGKHVQELTRAGLPKRTAVGR